MDVVVRPLQARRVQAEKQRLEKLTYVLYRAYRRAEVNVARISRLTSEGAVHCLAIIESAHPFLHHQRSS